MVTYALSCPPEFLVQLRELVETYDGGLVFLEKALRLETDPLALAVTFSLSTNLSKFQAVWDELVKDCFLPLQRS